VRKARLKYCIGISKGALRDVPYRQYRGSDRAARQYRVMLICHEVDVLAGDSSQLKVAGKEDFEAKRVVKVVVTGRRCRVLIANLPDRAFLDQEIHFWRSVDCVDRRDTGFASRNRELRTITARAEQQAGGKRW